MNSYPIAILNGPIVTTNGLYRISDISNNDAKKLIENNEILSAVGHESTAEILSEILDKPVHFNRIQFRQAVAQKAIIFKLNERPPEGIIYTKNELEKIGYSLKLMERLE